MTNKQIDLIIKKYIKAIKARNICIERVILFGSYARKQANKNSDIDVAVISPDFGKDYIEEAVMLKEISEDIDLDISPRPYSLEEYRKANKGEFLHDEILLKGRMIES